MQFTHHDSKGHYLDGGKTYKVAIPAPIPTKRFWSFMVYSGQHRSLLETDQKFAGLDSINPSVKPDEIVWPIATLVCQVQEAW